MTRLRHIPLAAVGIAIAGAAFAQETVFVGTSVGGGSDPWFLVDPDTQSVIAQGASPRVVNIRGAFYHPNASEFVVTSETRREISSSPLLGTTPDFTTPTFLTTIPSINVGSSELTVFDAVFDDVHNRIFTIGREGGLFSTRRQLHILNGDPDSPNYGELMSTTEIPFLVASEDITLSDDGNTLIVIPSFFMGTFAIVDVDPASPTFLTVTESAPTGVPSASPFIPLALGGFVGPNSRFVTFLFSGNFLPKYDLQDQVWIDSDPTMTGTQHRNISLAGGALSSRTLTHVPGTETAIIATVMAGSTGGTIGLIDAQGTDPTAWSYNVIQTVPNMVQGLGLSPDGTRFGAAALDPQRLIVGDVSTGVIQAEVLLPTSTDNLFTVVWSDVDVSIGENFCGPAVVNTSGSSATLSALGSDLASENNLEIQVDSSPPGSFGILIVSQDRSFVQGPGGSQGNLCLGGAVGRYILPGQIQQADSTGSWSLPLDLTLTPQPAQFISVSAGDTLNFQAWFRDFSPSGVASSNFTDGLAVVFL